MDDARALLNSLMGVDRHLRADQRRVRHYSDSDICRSFLLGLCPHELFKNTKIDLGACTREHNEHFKEVFESDADGAKHKRRWRNGLMHEIRILLTGVDRRITQNRQRIALEKEGGQGMKEESKQHLAALKGEVSEKLKQAENAADDGKFSDSRALINDAEVSKRAIEDFQAKRYEKYKKEEICEVCGLIIDTEEQEAMKTDRGWHTNGKQHIGYRLLREKLEEFESERARDKKAGLPSPSPSPVRVQKPEKVEEVKRRKASRSRSQAKAQKADGRRRKASRSRSPVDKKKKGSRSRSPVKAQVAESKRRRGSRSRSPSKGRKTERRRRPSPDKRSASRRKRSRSRKKKSSSRERRTGSREKKSAGKKVVAATSPARKSKSIDKAERKSQRRAASVPKPSSPADEVPPPPAEDTPPPPRPAAADPLLEAKKATAVDAVVASNGKPAAAEKAPTPAKPAEPTKPKSVADRAAPVFMVFKRK